LAGGEFQRRVRAIQEHIPSRHGKARGRLGAARFDQLIHGRLDHTLPIMAAPGIAVGEIDHHGQRRQPVGSGQPVRPIKDVVEAREHQSFFSMAGGVPCRI